MRTAEGEREGRARAVGLTRGPLRRVFACRPVRARGRIKDRPGARDVRAARRCLQKEERAPKFSSRPGALLPRCVIGRLGFSACVRAFGAESELDRLGHGQLATTAAALAFVMHGGIGAE